MRYLGLLALTIAPIFPTLVYTARKRKARTTDADLPAALDRVMARIHRGPVTLTAEEEIALREVVAFVTERDEMPDHVQWAMRRLRDVERRCAC
jgi:hypothetical protein